MKYKNVKLKWKALNWDINQNKLKVINVLSDELKKEIYTKIKSKQITSFEELKETIRNYLLYYFWSKREAEVLIGDLSSKYPDDFQKVDVYFQVIPNLDHITNYIISAMNIKFNK